MLSSTKKKTGRPLTFHRDRHGKRHEGLKRLGDGRWRISGVERYTYTEPNEDLAVAHFKEWTAKRAGTSTNLGKLVVHSGAESAVRDIARRANAAGGSLTTIAEQGPSGSGFAITDETLSPQQWAWLGRQIITRPLWVAGQCGVEQIGYLPTIKRPAPLPTLAQLAGVWEDKFNSSPEQKRKCPTAFKDFCDIAGIKELTDITAEAVIVYRDAVFARNLTGKTQSNIFTRIRRYLSFFRDRAVAIDEMTRAIGYLALLSPDETTVTLDPRPIEVADWQALLKSAKGDDRAMILLMLNAAMYLQEVIRVRWSEIRDGCLVTHRSKTGKCVRVAALWPETIKALGTVTKRGEYIFNNYAGTPLGIKGAEKRFRDLRGRAKLTVTPSQLRDGAYTAAVAANVTTNLCQLLVGHRSGLADHYVKRKPSMVAPACVAIHRLYFPNTKKVTK